MREEAAQMKDAEARRLMLERAERYERLARHLERREPEPEGEQM
jgi:ribosomal protein S15P/S13E